jgi:hypothetical protein
MIIARWKPGAATSNFGDALNEYLWPKVLEPGIMGVPGVFYGIGTMLGAAMPNEDIYVFGAGAGYNGPPAMTPRWFTYFVRGPHTAKAMGGVPFITDPGHLTSTTPSPRPSGPPPSCLAGIAWARNSSRAATMPASTSSTLG